MLPFEETVNDKGLTLHGPGAVVAAEHHPPQQIQAAPAEVEGGDAAQEAFARAG